MPCAKRAGGLRTQAAGRTRAALLMTNGQSSPAQAPEPPWTVVLSSNQDKYKGKCALSSKSPAMVKNAHKETEKHTAI